MIEIGKYSLKYTWHLGELNYRCCRERVKQRLALYQGVIPIHMEFSDDAEETFSRAISSLLVRPCAVKFHCWSFAVSSSDKHISALLHLFFLFFRFLFWLIIHGLNAEQKAQYVKKGDYVTLVQSGVTSIWREESTHNIQVRRAQVWCESVAGEVLIAPLEVLSSSSPSYASNFNVLPGDCYVELYVVSNSRVDSGPLTLYSFIFTCFTLECYKFTLTAFAFAFAFLWNLILVSCYRRS
jgi:hypothetical protein